VRRAESLGFTDRTAGKIATLPPDEIVQHAVAVLSEATPKPVVLNRPGFAGGHFV
jgi:hypothetical protein